MFRILGITESSIQSKRILLSKKSYRQITACFKSHYAVLELDCNATPQQIKTAYYRLSIRYHPDKNNGSMESVKKFREISEAYEILGNAEKKKSYDHEAIYRESDWKEKQSYTARSRRYTSPKTGRDQYYNYDEHYRQHYEEYDRQRRVDFEHFRRRWGADYRRRNPHSEAPEYSKPEEPVMREINWKFIFTQNKFILYFMTAWAGLFFVTYINALNNNEWADTKFEKSMLYKAPRQTKVYYKIHEKSSICKEN